MKTLGRGLRGRRSALAVAALLALATLFASGCGDIEVATAGDVPGGGGQDVAADQAGGDGGGCPGGVCPCTDDTDCREAGHGFFCEDGACTTGTVEGRFFLVIEVTGAAAAEDPSGIVSTTVDETTERIDLDASASAYVGPGTPTWVWTVVDDAGLELPLQDAATKHAWFGMPPIHFTEVFELTCTADDGTGEPGGRATATVTVTVRNVLNEPPVVDVWANPEEAVTGQLVVLDATSTWDPNDDALAPPFRWEQTAGPTVTLEDRSTDADQSVMSFAAPSVAADAELTFRVSIADDADEPAEGSGDVTVRILAGGCESHAECADGNPCTTDTCGAGGACNNEPVGDDVPCTDDDVCTSGDSCQGGVCRAGSARVCPDDDDPCTRPVCSDPAGCGFEPALDEPCDDGDPCTVDDACVDGTCVGTPDAAACECTSHADCDDGNPCNGEESCDLDAATPTCLHGAAVECPALPNPCQRNVCVPATGQCATQNLPDETECDDGLFCTVGDRCTSGACGGLAAPCLDTDTCTEDSCDEAGDECVFTPIDGCCRDAGDCDDNDPCTTDSCPDGTCQSAPISGCGGCTNADDCADPDPCTANLCNTQTGQCTNPALPTGAPCLASPTGTETAGLCDAQGACVAFRRSVWGTSSTDADWGSGINALWQGSADTPVFAAGWRHSAEPHGLTGGTPVVFRLESAGIGSLVPVGQLEGSFTDINAGAAVGPGGVALLTTSGWEEGGFQNVDRGTLRRLVGYYQPSTGVGAWYVVDQDGSPWWCLGEQTFPIGIPWSCGRADLQDAFAGPGPIVGGIDWDDLSPRAELWYFAHDTGGYRPIWYGQRSTTSTQTTWTTAEPEGCDPRGGDAGCVGAKSWNDAFLDPGPPEGDAHGDVWGVGDAGTVSRLPALGRGFEAVAFTRAQLSGVAPDAIAWTGVWVSGRHVFLVGWTEACIRDVCPTDVVTRSVVLMYYDGARNLPRGLAVLGQRDCTWSEFNPEVPQCSWLPADRAVANDVWGVFEDGVVHLWVAGAWPFYEQNAPEDVRAALWTIELPLE